MSSEPVPDADRGVYGITVAAELVGLEAQSLRLYESRGLLTPERTDGGTRRYSANDLARLRRIADLMASGVNLTGVGMLLDLQDENTRLRGEMDARRPPVLAERPPTAKRSTAKPSRTAVSTQAGRRSAR